MTGPSVLRTQMQFAVVPEWVIFHPRLSSMAVRVYAGLARYANVDGVSFPSTATLAARLALSERSVQHAVNELTENHALICQPTYVDAAGGRHLNPAPGLARTSNTYTLLAVPHAYPPPPHNVRSPSAGSAEERESSSKPQGLLGTERAPAHDQPLTPAQQRQRQLALLGE